MVSPTFPQNLFENMKNLTKFIGVLLCVWLISAASVFCFVIDAPTTSWHPVPYPNGNVPDPFSDQQTGSYESDIVGTSNHPALYTHFDNAKTPSPTDGSLAFRFRMAGEKQPAGYSGAVFVGLDANMDGVLDIFLGVNNSGSKNEVGIWNAGNSLNVSPSTTSIDTKNPYATYVETVANYNWSPLSSIMDPLASTMDVNADGNTDYFISFSVNFNDVVNALNAKGISGVTQNTTMLFVGASSTQANSLNQDLNGVNGGASSSLTWKQLGAISNPITPAYVMPEPSTVSLFALSLVIGVISRRIRRD